MTATEPIWWYECDVLPVVGFVRAPDAESARAAALDDAVSRVSAFMDEGTWKLQLVLPTTEVTPHERS